MKSRAFTLIELLVVIGIITFLVTIVIPVMSLVRQYSRVTRCGSNLRQITISLINFDLKEGNFPYSFLINSVAIPPHEELIGNFLYDIPGWRWQNYIFEDSKDALYNNPVFWCPSRT